MATPIIMPKFGQMTEESTIVEWFKQEGDRIAKGDLLFAVETDKSVMEVESFAEGTLIKIAVGPGVSVPVQSVVGYLGRPGEAVPATSPPAPKAAPPAAPSFAPATKAAAPAAAMAPAAAPAASRFRISPRAAALARECVIDPTRIEGSGAGGRVVEKDVMAYLEASGYRRLRVSAAARELAAREKLDLLSIPPADGRIGLDEVERAVAEKPVPMSRMRQVIAQRLTQSVLTAPHFFVTVETDMTDLLAFRASLGAGYTVTDFIAAAAVRTLKEFPRLNSSTDGRSVRWHGRVHLGLAVSLDDGLVVPVIRGADELTMAELSARAREMFARARAGSLAPDEMTGSTFTISNMGMLDVENFTAIINPGEAAILAVSSATARPVVRDGKVAVRSVMKMTLSSDHRLIDGAAAARFVNALKQKLEDVESWRPLT